MKKGIILIIIFICFLFAWPEIKTEFKIMNQLDSIRLKRVREENKRYLNTERNISKASCEDLQFAYNRCIDSALFFEGKCRQVFMSTLNRKCIK